MAFLNDIKSKHLGNFVLVTIGEHRISTRKINFDEMDDNNNNLVTKYYKPILLNIPSISESLDIEQRKYKISSVSLSISDYMEDGVRFSDSLNTLMNEEVVIWFASQSSKSLDDAECYKAGTFIVRSFSQNEDKVTLNCEDLSQDKLHKDLLGENFDSTIDKYKSKPLPMVFGQVEKSPCVATTLDTGEMGIYADDENSVTSIDPSYYGKLNTVLGQPLSIFKNDKYLNVLSDAGIVSMWGFTETTQYEIDQSPIIRLSVNSNPDSEDADISIKSPLGFNYAGVVIEDDPIKIKLLKEDLSFGVNGVGTTNIVYEAEDFNDVVEISATSSGGYTYNRYSEKHIFDDLPDKVNADDDNPDYGRTYNRFIIDYNVNLSDFIGSNKTYRLIRANEPEINTWNASTGDSNINFSESFEIDGDYSEGERTELYNEFQIALFTQDFGASAQGQLYVNSLTRHIIYLMSNFHSSNFFAQAIGRGGATPTLQSIYTEILSELDFNTNTINNELSLGKYAFTIDKKINSKKLIEEISRSSGLFPYFKDGEFNVKSIKKTYSDPVNIGLIKQEDVMSYKYDRTKIEKVYTSVNVKYHYDYGLKDFTKETGDITPNNLSYLEGNGESHPVFNAQDGYNTNYFGEDFDQPFVFESKYIRDSETATNLAKYLIGLYANQHNLITLKLPLNYLTLELGDVVRFDKLIQGRKIFGENYGFINPMADVSYGRNGQTIYKYWFVTQIKKNLDFVELKLYQLHEFNFDGSIAVIPEVPEPIIIQYCGNPEATNYENPNSLIDDDEFIYEQNNNLCVFPEVTTGCTDPGAINYNPDATQDDGSCEYLGCTNPNAINYNDNATVDDGTCVIPSIVQYCNLPVDNNGYPYVEYFLANGNGDIVDIGNPPVGVTYEENNALCQTVTDPYPDVLGHCLLPNNTVNSGVSEFECTQVQSGQWQTMDNPFVFGCMDSNALNYNEGATVSNDSCQYPVEIQPPVIILPIDDAIIDAEFTEAVEGQEGDQWSPPDYEIITNETHRTFSLSTPEAHNTFWTSRTSSVPPRLIMTHGLGYIGMRASQPSLNNYGLKFRRTSDWWAQVAVNDTFKIRVRVRATSPNLTNTSFRFTGIRRLTNNGYPGGNSVTTDGSWHILNIGGGENYIKNNDSDLLLLFYGNNTTEENTEIQFDWMQFIPINQEYYIEEEIESGTPYQPPVIINPSIDLNFTTSSNLLSPANSDNPIPNTGYKVEVKKDGVIFYDTDLGEYNDSTEVNLNIDLDPLQLPLNTPLNLIVTAYDYSNTSFHTGDIATDTHSFTWTDDTGALSGIIDDVNNIISLLFGAIYSDGVGELTPEQLELYGGGDGIIGVNDLNDYINSVLQGG